MMKFRALFFVMGLLFSAMASRAAEDVPPPAYNIDEILKTKDKNGHHAYRVASVLWGELIMPPSNSGQIFRMPRPRPEATLLSAEKVVCHICAFDCEMLSGFGVTIVDRDRRQEFLSALKAHEIIGDKEAVRILNDVKVALEKKWSALRPGKGDFWTINLDDVSIEDSEALGKAVDAFDGPFWKHQDTSITYGKLLKYLKENREQLLARKPR